MYSPLNHVRNVPLFPKDTIRDTIETFLLVLGYGILLHIILFFLYKAGVVAYFPSAITLERWDAGLYHKASEVGYYYISEQNNNAGIYILFPWVWKVLHVGIVGIAFVNLVFFALSITIITLLYPTSTANKILWVTTPSLYFMWVPYSEALFCLLSVISFYGIVKKNTWLTWFGLFSVSLCRATAVFLIPALLIMELLANNRKDVWRSVCNYLIHYALPTLFGSFAFILIQYAYTGQWFPYFKGQAKYLGHTFSWPELPFCDFYGGDRVTWLCALAMLPCVIALGLLVVRCYKWLVSSEVYIDKVWSLTLAYLPVILFTMVFCNPKWGYGKTNLLGIHRYVFCSPYFFIFLYHTSFNRTYKLRHYLFLVLTCNIIWLSMGSYWHLHFLLFYNLNTLLAIGYMFAAGKGHIWAIPILCATNLFFQVQLYQQFLGGLFTD